MSNTTLLGQPLNFEAMVRLGPDESLSAECVQAEVSAGENRLVQPLINVQVEAAADPGLRRVRVRTTTSIDEPVVTVQLTLGCDGKVTRKFVAFVDPPEFRLAQSSAVGQAPAPAASAAAPSEPPPVVAAAPEAQSRPVASAPRASTASPRPARRSGGSVRAAKRRSTDVADAPQARRSTPAGVSAARPATGPVSRLKLEPAPPILSSKAVSAPQVATAAAPAPVPAAAPAAAAAVPAASASAPETLASAPAAAASAAAEVVAADLLANERSRLLALEESFKRVRDETQAAQKALVSLQARVKEAEAQRYANPLVYALAGISALLALAVAGLWWRQVRAQREAKWWGTVAPSMAAASELPSQPPRQTSGFAELSVPPDLPKPAARVVTAPETAKVVWADSRQTEPAPDLVPEPRRDLSVEELIDLEQQAEFFVVLGQDDAAIDLLMGHVRSTGGISPLPYLKLLEIYRRRGDRSAYERIRERFNRRFNAYAPDWDADLQQGRSLEDYPATIARLEALWVMPQRVMETLEASLFRRDETEEAFDLPAYRELLFLYAVARDFANRSDDSSAVDLLLPMDTDAPSAPVSRLVASMPAALSAKVSKPGAASESAAGDSRFDFALDGDMAGSPSSAGGPVTQSGLSVDLGSLGLVDDAAPKDKPEGSGSK